MGRATCSNISCHIPMFGVQMVMEDDEGPYNNGGIWIYKPMSYTKGTNATGGEVIEVRSLVLIRHPPSTS